MKSPVLTTVSVGLAAPAAPGSAVRLLATLKPACVIVAGLFPPSAKFWNEVTPPRTLKVSVPALVLLSILALTANKLPQPNRSVGVG